MTAIEAEEVIKNESAGVQALWEAVNGVKNDLQTLLKAFRPDEKFYAKPVVNVADIAEHFGLSKNAIRKSEYRYLQPNWGVSEFPEGWTRWRIETFIAWENELEKHKERWKSMNYRERARIVNSK